MIQVRKSQERGHANHGWLDSYHTFSFAGYQDPEHMGFRVLRVINEDRVSPGEGFGTHGHRDMEIISYVLEGALEHKDSLGSGSVLRPGDVQRMSAGRGVEHSEFNGSKTATTHFLQIWILPRENGGAPGYEEKRFPLDERQNQLKLLVAPDGRNGALRIGQDAQVFGGLLDAGRELGYAFGPGRSGWVQVARGSLQLNGVRLSEGDGAAISDERELRLKVEQGKAEFLLFDLP